MKPIVSKQTLHWCMVILLGICAASLFHSIVLPGSQINAPTVAVMSGNTLAPFTEAEFASSAANKKESVVQYNIAVALQPKERRLIGSQFVGWTNPSAHPITELYFHLYPNAFASPKTTFNKESKGKHRNSELKENQWGSMELLKLQTTTGDDLLARTSFIQPDDDNPDDSTLMKVQLPTAVQPNEKIVLQMDFEVQLPYVYARMGYADEDFYMAGQWFPKLAKYDPSGVRGQIDGGWNLHQYHGNSEFYADFGQYDVRVQVPASYIVAATGLLVKEPIVDGTLKTYHFYAEDVHDFAWSASPHFIYAEEPFSTPNIPGMKIKLYLDPKHKHLQQRYFQAAKKSLLRFSEWYGEYPYSTLSIVVPPAAGQGAGGMEYPTLITSWAATDEHPTLELERVIAHEIGHQFFYGIVASNEFEEAWLDEGFTSYIEAKVMEKEYGASPHLSLESIYMTSPAPLKQFSWHYNNSSEYADNVYTRSKLVLYAMERQLSDALMKKVMKTYFQQWQFKHPRTEDFQQVVENVTGESWEAFFNTFIYGNDMIDYSISSIRVREHKQADGTIIYDNEVVIRKLGAAHSSVPIVFRFSDGSEITKEWDSEQANDSDVIRYTLKASSPLLWAAIDPEHTILLENKRINNFLFAQTDTKSNVRWSLSIAKIVETIISLVAW